MRLNSNPSFRSRKEEDAGYRAIARFVLFWGPLELLIEHYIVRLRAHPKGAGEWVFPVSFSRKVDELKDLLKESGDIAKARDGLRPLLGRAKEIHDIRVHVAHSIFQGQNLKGELMFGRSDQKRGVAYTESRYSIAQLEAAALECIDLHEQMGEFMDSIQDYCAAKFKRRYSESISRASGKAGQ